MLSVICCQLKISFNIIIIITKSLEVVTQYTLHTHLETVFVDRWTGVRYAQESVQRSAGDGRVVYAAGKFTGFDPYSR